MEVSKQFSVVILTFIAPNDDNYNGLIDFRKWTILITAIIVIFPVLAITAVIDMVIS